MARLSTLSTLLLLVVSARCHDQDKDHDHDNDRNGPSSTQTSTATSSSSTAYTSCPPLHIICARESKADPGTGQIGSLANLTQSDNPGADIVAVDYPATVTNYNESCSQGISALTQLLQDFATQCPTSPVVLMGYSQGAEVVGDTLCGGGGLPELGDPTDPVPANLSSQVVAVVQMGDPRNIMGQPQDFGNDTEENGGYNGMYPRQPYQLCPDTITPRMRSYCDQTDPVCANGSEADIDTHLTYTDRYNDDARAFVNSLVRAAASSASSSSSASVAATASPTAAVGSGASSTASPSASQGAAASIRGKPVQGAGWMGVAVVLAMVGVGAGALL